MPVTKAQMQPGLRLVSFLSQAHEPTKSRGRGPIDLGGADGRAYATPSPLRTHRRQEMASGSRLSAARAKYSNPNHVVRTNCDKAPARQGAGPLDVL
jgi:hypothetical protein